MRANQPSARLRISQPGKNERKKPTVVALKEDMRSKPKARAPCWA